MEKYVQIQNFRTKEWIKINTKTGKILKTNKKKFNNIMVYSKPKNNNFLGKNSVDYKSKLGNMKNYLLNKLLNRR